MIYFYNDPHIHNLNPRCRLDNYPKSILNKMEEMFKLLTPSDILICTGDFLHKPTVSNEYLHEVINTLAKCPCPHYILVGNHSTLYANSANIHLSSLHVLDATPYLNILSQPIQYQGYSIYPYDYNQEIQNLPTYQPKSICIAHCLYNFPLIPQDADGKWENYSTAKLQQANYNYYIFGHDHTTYSTEDISIDGVNPQILIRTGSLCRIARNQREHIPIVTKLDTSTGEISYIQLSVNKEDITAQATDTASNNLFTAQQQLLQQQLLNLSNEIEQAIKAPENQSIEELMRDLNIPQDIQKIIYKYLDTQDIDIPK